MAWFRAGGGNGIPTQLKDNMDAVLNKKFGTSTTYPPGEWPDDVNLLGVLEEKTTTKSAIAHITDGADRVPVKNWQVTLGASLDGVSSLTCKQAKKNICTVLPWARDTHFWGSSWSEMVTFLNTLPPGNYSVSYDFEITAVVGDSIDVSYAPYIRANVDGTMVNITPYPTPQTDSTPTVGKTYHCQSIFGLTAATVGKVAYFYLYCGKTGAKVAEVTVKNAQIELDSAPTTYEAPEITTNTVSLGRTIYGGSVDVVNGTGTDENGNDFTFTPITPTPKTALGVNNFWADEGDSQVTYRSSGTETIIAPDLTTKSITANGTYNASSDNADGYSSVTVNVPTTPIISETDWNNLTDAQKRTYGLVIIQQANSGYKRGLYVNGADYPVLEEYSDVLTTGLSLDVLVDTTHTIECCFYALGYVNDGHVMGTTTGNHRNFHLTTYNNMWYFEGDVGKADNQLYPVAGGMDITFRQEGDTAYMNGNSVGSIGLVAGGTFYALAQRGSTMTGNNYKYKYVKIWDANDNLIHDFRFMANKTMIDLVTLNTKTYT